MGQVVFIDTSVMLNILDVPTMNTDRRPVLTEFIELQTSATLVLPVATLIETGNHIAHISDGGLRRKLATTFETAIRGALSKNPPWVLTGDAWNTSQMAIAILDGNAHRPRAQELLTHGIGTGDVSILAEIDSYRKRIPSGITIRLWTLDAALLAYAPA